MDNLFKISKLFLKLSAFQFTPEMEWVPQRFKELPPFQEFPHEKAIKEFAKYGLKDFREKLEVDDQYGIELADNLIKDISDILEILINDISNQEEEFNQDQEQIENFKDALLLIDTSVDKKLTFTVAIKIGKKQYPVGTSIFKAYQAFEPIAQKYDLDLPRLETLQSFKEYSKRPKNFWVVFSTQPQDMIGISERGIETCQSLFDLSQEFDITQYNQCLVGNVLSKYIGVIYITSGTDFKGRGEKMIYRSMVRLIKDLDSNQITIYIDNMYPETNTKYLSAFREALEKRTNLPVTHWEEYGDPLKQILPLEDMEEELPHEYRSYKDFETLSKLKYFAREGDEIQKIYAARNLPIDSLELVNLLQDDSPDVVLEAAKRVPFNILKTFIAEYNTDDIPGIIELYNKREANQ